MLVVFEKGTPLRHVGHLDLMRTMQRVLRRTGLPVAYSQGFNPHMLVKFAAPLSVGASGLREIMDVALFENVEEMQFLKKMNEALPPSLKAVMVRSLEDTHPALMSLLHAAAYEICVTVKESTGLAETVPAFLQKSRIPAIRKTKSGEKQCDLRPMIYDLSVKKEGEGITFSAVLALREEATCKPDLLMETLCKECNMDIPSYLVQRTALFGCLPNGGLVPLESL